MCRSRSARLQSCVVFLLIACGCGRTTWAGLDDFAARYVRLAVALGERDPDSLDFYAGPAASVADVRRNPPSLPEIKRQAEALRAKLSRIAAADASRAAAIAADLSAIATRVDLLTGKRLPYADESLAFFGVAPGAMDEPRMDELRAQIAAGVGAGGRLVDRYAAFAARFTVPADRLSAVMQAALDECRTRTLAHIPLPPGEHVTLEFVRDKPWSAFSRYLGDAHSSIQINTDFRFTVDQALQIACHEGYPGHHARNVAHGARDVVHDAHDVAHDFSRAAERSVQLTFSRESLASEASAMLAADVAFPAEERVRFERERLFRLAGLDPSDAERHITVERLVGELQIGQAHIAQRYLDGELEFTRAAAALEEQVLVPHAEALLKYINEYRSYVTTYTAGRAQFAAQLAACAGAEPDGPARWRCFLDLRH